MAFRQRRRPNSGSSQAGLWGSLQFHLTHSHVVYSDYTNRCYHSMNRTERECAVDDVTDYQTKSEVIAVRLTPKMRIALELNARLKHRSMAQTVERALERFLANTDEGLFAPSASGEVRNVLADVWSVSPVVRLVRLAVCYPSLLSYEEQAIWELVLREGRFMREVSWGTHNRPEDAFDVDAIEAAWPMLLERASAYLGGVLDGAGRPARKPRVKRVKSDIQRGEGPTDT